MPSVSEHLEAPIIIIGAGRSGTYLLERMLNAHPDILMYGETAFLLPRLWRELWENSPPVGLNDHRLRDTTIYTGPPPKSGDQMQEMYESVSEPIQDIERRRMARLAGATLLKALGVSPDGGGRWGYRELWNGSAAFQYDWVAYDFAFPQAFWVQLIRNPFDFAVSCAGWNGKDLTEVYLEQRLQDWAAMTECGRQRRRTSRYHEVRYEDLVAEPAAVLKPLLDRLGLPWDEGCAAQLRDRSGQSAHRPALPATMLNPISGLAETMEELGYEFPEMYR